MSLVWLLKIQFHWEYCDRQAVHRSALVGEFLDCFEMNVFLTSNSGEGGLLLSFWGFASLLHKRATYSFLVWNWPLEETPFTIGNRTVARWSI